MKARLFATSVILFGAIFALPSAAQENARDNGRKISVTGTMETRVNPDTLSWTIAVTEQDPVLQKAKERCTQKTEKALQLIKDLAIPPNDVQTGFMDIRKEFTESPILPKTFKQWSIVRTISFKQKDLSRFDEFLDALIANADVEVSYTLESSKYHEARAEARTKALELARQKAQSMCETLGVKLGRPVSISSDSQGNPFLSSAWPQPPNMASNGSITLSYPSSSDGGTLVAGTIEIRETANVTFEFE